MADARTCPVLPILAMTRVWTKSDERKRPEPLQLGTTPDSGTKKGPLR